MNEFGEIAIDSKIIVVGKCPNGGPGGGCVCCSTGEFEAVVMKSLIVDPDNIVETTE